MKHSSLFFGCTGLLTRTARSASTVPLQLSYNVTALPNYRKQCTCSQFVSKRFATSSINHIPCYKNKNCLKNYISPCRYKSSTEPSEELKDDVNRNGELSKDPRLKQRVLSLDDIYQHIMEENGRDVVVINLASDTNYVEHFIVVTANSTRHLIHMAESLNRLYKQKKSPSDPFMLIEGKGMAKDWQCIDFGNAVVHFMLEEVREKYQLEKLWLLGPQYDDLTKEIPTLQEILERVTDKGLFLLSDNRDNSTFMDDIDIVNPWEMDYDEENDKDDMKPNKLWDDDEDAYII